MSTVSEYPVSYERLQTAVDAAGVGTWDLNPATGELIWSARCKELFGLPPAAPVSYDSFWEGLHPDDHAQLRAAVERALDPEGPGAYEEEYRTVGLQDGGQVRWVRATGRAYFDETRTRAVRFIGTITDISRPRLQQLQLQRLHDLPVIGIFYWDMHSTRVRQANAQYLRIVGYTADELAAGQVDWAAITPPEYQAADQQALAELRRGGQHRPYAKEYQRPDGSRVPVLVGGALVEPGAEQGISFCLDLSAQKEAQRRSDAREREFRFLADSIPQIVWTADAAGSNTYLNQRWTEYTGMRLDESLGSYAWQAMLHPQDRVTAGEQWRRCLRTGETFQIEYRIKSRSGEFRWFLGRAEPLKDADGRVLEWFGSCTDIHEQKQIQQSLHVTEERYRLVALASNDAIWEWDLHTDALTWTTAIERVFGYEADQVDNRVQWWYERIHPDEAERVVQGIHAAVDGGSASWQDEYRFRRADGTYVHVLDRGHIARDEQGRGRRMIGAMQNLTQPR